MDSAGAGSAKLDDPVAYGFYDDLAAWWPLISPHEEYEEEAAYSAALLRSASVHVRNVLELGSGGGHNAIHLKATFQMTLVDLSEQMLAISRQLNPECDHRQGDMRTIRLGRLFDAVFVHDAVGYMVTEDDMRRAIETTFVHCRPGGTAVFIPDHTRETFEESTDHGGADGIDGRAARYLAWDWDPDPTDRWILTDYVFLLREVDGSVRTVHERHRIGLFSRADWIRLLEDIGFEPSIVTEVTTEQRTARDIFIGHRPTS